jgi:dipeptidyl aminopeptidase/acylaminoacyl peptidase
LILIVGLQGPANIPPTTGPDAAPGAGDFFKHPDAWTFRLSPDGKLISYLGPSGSARRLNIFVQTLSGGQDARVVTAETARDILSYFWKGNDYLVYPVDRQRDEKPNVYFVDLRRPELGAIDLTTKLGVISVIAQLDDSDEEMLVRAISEGRTFLFRLKLATLAMTKLIEFPAEFGGWVIDRTGIVRGVRLVDGLDVTLRTRPDGDSEFRTVVTSDFRHSIGTALLVKEPQGPKEMIYAIANIDRDTKALVRIDPDTGERKELYANEQFDVSGMEVSRQDGVTCAQFISSHTERFFLSEAAQGLYGAIKKELNLKNEEVEIVARARDEKKFVVLISSDLNPGDAYLFEHKPNGTLTIKKLAERMPGLAENLSPTEPIEYHSGDLTIHGYLTIPREHDGQKRLPLVVIPHGGPWVRNTWGYSPRENREVQFFASRGYAVLQMNFRGSTGYGCKFWEAGFEQWGRAMQDDITEGVRWAINTRKIADPESIAIVGESYGGYAALAAISFRQDFQYAAAVSRAGISDLVRRMEKHKSPQQREMVGDPDADLDELKAVSPALYADHIRTPLFIAHGIHDGEVDPSQSLQIFKALSDRNADVEYLELEEGHIFWNEESKIEYYEKVERFLGKHLR